MRPFEHIDATSVEDAVSLLRSEPDSAMIAGGTDLLGLMKDRLVNPRLLINVKKISGLGDIEATSNGGLKVGALATLAALGESQVVRSGYPIITDAVRVMASPQLRNVATVSGNLCQRPRCWYYRGSFECFMNGAKRCLALDGHNRDAGIFGGEKCYAVNPSDLVPPLVALGASVSIRKGEGREKLPLEDFFIAPRKGRPWLNVLDHDCMIVDILVPKQPEGARGVYLKTMERKAWSFALASVAVQLSRAGEAVSDVRIVLGGVAPVPWRARAAEDVVRGKVPDPVLIESAAAAAVAGAHPLSENGYKVSLVRELVRRGLFRVLGEVQL